MSRLRGTVLILLLAILCAAPAQTPVGSTTNAGTSGTVPTQFSQAAWTPYVPTTTHLTSVTSTGFAIQNGKTAFVSLYVTGTSDGSTPVLGLPYTMANTNQFIPCLFFNSVAWTGATGNAQNANAIAVAKYDASSPVNATVYIFNCQGVYQTN